MNRLSFAVVAMVPALMGNQGGCGASEPPITKVVVQGDTFCRLTTDPKTKTFELTWDVQDTPETITGIERLGAKYQRVCRGRKNMVAVK